MADISDNLEQCYRAFIFNFVMEKTNGSYQGHDYMQQYLAQTENPGAELTEKCQSYSRDVLEQILNSESKPVSAMIDTPTSERRFDLPTLPTSGSCNTAFIIKRIISKIDFKSNSLNIETDQCNNEIIVKSDLKNKEINLYLHIKSKNGNIILTLNRSLKSTKELKQLNDSF